MSSRVLVTYKDNLTIFADGSYELKDASLIGHCTKTHALTAQSFDPETQQLQTGVTFRSEVYWEHARSPSPSFEDPQNMAWINFTDEQENEDDENEDDETNDSDEESSDQ